MKKLLYILLTVAMLATLTSCGRSKDTAEETEDDTSEAVSGSQTEDEQPDEMDMTPPDFADYAWVGDYLDSTGGQAVLNIAPAEKRANGYDIMIYIPGGESSFTTWTATAYYEADLGGLHYANCVRTDTETGDLGESIETYRDGEGVLIPTEPGSNTLLWIDDVDGRGVDLRFERMETE